MLVRDGSSQSQESHFRLKHHPKRVSWAQKGRSFGSSAGPKRFEEIQNDVTQGTARRSPAGPNQIWWFWLLHRKMTRGLQGPPRGLQRPPAKGSSKAACVRSAICRPGRVLVHKSAVHVMKTQCRHVLTPQLISSLRASSL